MNASSKEVLTKMQDCITHIDRLLRERHQSPEMQIADVESYCWAMVELACELKDRIYEEELGG